MFVSLIIICSCSRETVTNLAEDNDVPLAMTARKLSSESDIAANNVIEKVNTSFFELAGFPVNIISKENINGDLYLTTQGTNSNAIFTKQNNSENQKFYLEFTPESGSEGLEIHTYINGQKYVMTTGINPATNSMIPKIRNNSFRGTFWSFLAGSGTVHPDSYILQNRGIRYIENGVTTYGVIGNSNESKIFIDKYLAQGKQEFEIRPCDDFEIIGLEYDNPDTGTALKQPDFITTWFYSNNTSVQQSMTTAFSKKASITSNWSKTTGGTVNVNTTFKTGIPIIAEGKITTSLTSTNSATYGKSETMEDTQTYNFPIVVAPKSSITATATVGRYLINLGYTAKLRGKNTGKLITLRGVWKGVTCTDIKVVMDQKDLRSSIITRKILNEIPEKAIKL